MRFKPSRKRVIVSLVVLLPLMFIFRDLWIGPFKPYSICHSRMSFVSHLLINYSLKSREELEPATNEELIRILEAMPASFALPATGPLDRLMSGEYFPDELIYDRSRRCLEPQFRFESFHLGKIMCRDYWEFLYMAQAKSAIGELKNRGAAEYYAWILEKADQLPPARLDAFMHLAQFPGQATRDEFTPEIKEIHRKMAYSKNPIYRYWARGSAGRWVENSDELLRLSIENLEERTSLFHYSGLRKLDAVDAYHPEIVAALEEFIDRDDVVPNDGTMYELDRDISVLDMAADVLARQKELSEQASIP